MIIIVKRIASLFDGYKFFHRSVSTLAKKIFQKGVDNSLKECYNVFIRYKAGMQ